MIPIHVKKATKDIRFGNYILIVSVLLTVTYNISIEFAPKELRSRLDRGMMNSITGVTTLLGYFGGKAQGAREHSSDVYSDIDGDGIPDSPAQIKKMEMINRQIDEGRRQPNEYHP